MPILKAVSWVGCKQMNELEKFKTCKIGEFTKMCFNYLFLSSHNIVWLPTVMLYKQKLEANPLW
jgi:hypothetical protein